VCTVGLQQNPVGVVNRVVQSELWMGIPRWMGGGRGTHVNIHLKEVPQFHVMLWEFLCCPVGGVLDLVLMQGLVYIHGQVLHGVRW